MVFGILNFFINLLYYLMIFKFFNNGLEYFLMNDFIVEENVEIKIVL